MADENDGTQADADARKGKTIITVTAGDRGVAVGRMQRVTNTERSVVTDIVEPGKTMELELDEWLRIDLTEQPAPAEPAEVNDQEAAPEPTE